jgi:hypothetical protein
MLASTTVSSAQDETEKIQSIEKQIDMLIERVEDGISDLSEADREAICNSLRKENRTPEEQDAWDQYACK